MLRVFISSIAIFSLLHMGVPRINSQGEMTILNAAQAEETTTAEALCTDNCSSLEGTEWMTNYQGGGIFAMLVIFITGILFLDLWPYCIYAPDLIVASLLTIAFFIAEIVNAAMFKERLEELEFTTTSVAATETASATTTTALEYDINDANTTMQALINAKTSLEHTKNRITQRLWGVRIYAIGMGLGAALSLLALIFIGVPWVAAAFTCVVSTGPNYKYQDLFQDNPEPLFPEMFHEMYAGAIENSSSVSDSYLLFTEWNDLRLGANSSKLPDDYGHLSLIANSVVPELKILKEGLTTAIRTQALLASNGLIPPAFADTPDADYTPESEVDAVGMTGGIIGLLGSAGVLIMSLAKQSSYVLKPLFRRKKGIAVRLAVYIVVGILTAVASETLIKPAEEQMQEQIDTYDQLISAVANTITAQNMPDIPQITTDQWGFTHNANGTIETPTHTPPLPCNDNINATCTAPKKVNLKNSAFGGFKGGSLAVQTVNSAQSVASAAYNKNLSGMMNGIEDANSQASKLKKMLIKAEKEMVKKNKKYPKVSSKFLSSVRKQLLGTIKKNYDNLSTADKETIRRGLLIGSDNKLIKKAKKLQAMSPQLAAFVPKKAKKSEKDFNFDFSLEEEKIVPETAEDIAGLKDGEEFELNKGDDINKNDVSIFKIIETRYKRSAYPVFFKEIK